MKAFTHAALGTSAISICYVALIVCRGGTEVVITNAAQDVTVTGDANTYAAINADFRDISFDLASRASPTEIVIPLDETNGPFKPSEIKLGKFRGASITIWRADVSGGATKDWLFDGEIGDLKISPDTNQATIEARRDTSSSRAVVIRPFGSLCRASVFDYINPSTRGLCKLPGKVDDVARNTAFRLGDWARVRTGVAGNPLDYANRVYQCVTAGTAHASVVPSYDTTLGNLTTDGTAVFQAVEAYMRTVTVTAINSALEFTVSATGDARTVDDWFALGRYAINGIYAPSYPIRAWVSSTRRVKTWDLITGLLQVGDIVDLLPGCDKSLSRCAVFANVINRRAE